jgi:hypothetical protein
MSATRKKKQKYPPGWDEARVRKLAEHYDNQTDDEAVAEIEDALNDENQTLMMVPAELVPEIVKRINKNGSILLPADSSGKPPVRRV